MPRQYNLTPAVQRNYDTKLTAALKNMNREFHKNGMRNKEMRSISIDNDLKSVPFNVLPSPEKEIIRQI